ncbi:hypothetical protein GCM10022420_084700 [Streptomyces iranensis]
MSTDRQATDLEAYTARARSGPCFVCSFLAGHPGYSHETVYEDAGRRPLRAAAVPRPDDRERGPVRAVPPEEAADMAARLRTAIAARGFPPRSNRSPGPGAPV